MISIVMTAFNRPVQLNATLRSIYAQSENVDVVVVDDGVDDALTQGVCDSWGARYFKFTRPAATTYRNPARPINFGIRQTHGDIVVLQNAECMHIDPEAIHKLTGAVTENNAVFARVLALNRDGSGDFFYCAPEHTLASWGQPGGPPFFFCGAIKKSWFEKLHGFDEDYTGCGYDDNDFADRLLAVGVKFVYTDILVHHQWHPQAGHYDFEPMRLLYEKKKALMNSGTIGTVRNLDREWGAR